MICNDRVGVEVWPYDDGDGNDHEVYDGDDDQPCDDDEHHVNHSEAQHDASHGDGDDCALDDHGAYAYVLNDDDDEDSYVSFHAQVIYFQLQLFQ